MGYKPAITQDSLRHLWHCGQEGRLSAWQVAKALGLREASRELHGDSGNLPWIAARLVKIGGGIPTPQSLHELFAKIDADPDWFPGKHNGVKRGPMPLFTKAKRRAVATSLTAACSVLVLALKRTPGRARIVLVLTLKMTPGRARKILEDKKKFRYILDHTSI